jgi:hypothetical protein
MLPRVPKGFSPCQYAIGRACGSPQSNGNTTPDRCRKDPLGVQSGIAKDGTRAPLESDANADGRIEGGPANKDGNTMPLANQESGGDKNLATSQQDTESQQEGDETAAAKADPASDPCKQD